MGLSINHGGFIYKIVIIQGREFQMSQGKSSNDRPNKETILELSKYLDQEVLVETAGTRKGIQDVFLQFDKVLSKFVAF